MFASKSRVSWWFLPRLVVADAAMAWATSSCTMGQQKDCHASECSAAPWSLSLKVSACDEFIASRTHVHVVLHSLVAFAEKANEQEGEPWGNTGFTQPEAVASEWSAPDQVLFRSPDADWPHSHLRLFSRAWMERQENLDKSHTTVPVKCINI